MTLSVSNWLSLLGATLLFLGPGYALISFYPNYDRFSKTQVIALALGLAIAFWSILLAWLQALHITLTPIAVFSILGTGWILALIRIQPWKRAAGLPRTRRLLDINSIALWGTLTLIVGAGIFALWNTVVGPGSDSYHHTLITQIIVEHGGLPDTFEPYAPLITFTYHFGFHGIAAALVWLTSLNPVVMVPLLAQILMAASALSVGFFTQVTTGNRLAMTVSVVIAGLVSVFPEYYINWGRYTQLTGLILLPLFLGLIWHWIESGFHKRGLILIGFIAGGIALTHYRVTFMAASGAAVVIGLNGVLGRYNWSTWKRLIGRLLLAALLAGVLTAPWIWHVIMSYRSGYPIILDEVAPAFFSLDRLGGALYYPTNGIILGLLIPALVAGWWQRQRIVISLFAWSVVMLVLSLPPFGGAFMDTVSVFISLYFPTAVIIGWFVSTSTKWLAHRWQATRWAVGLGLVGLAIWGATAIGAIVESGSAYVGPDDLPAMEWIRLHTPTSARFMVNMYHFDFSPKFIIGSDAGYWLPLLGKRATVTVPMVYANERTASADFLDRLVALSQLNGMITSPEALALLRREGITYVYVGQRGGPIQVVDLIHSPDFKLVYHNGTAYVFEIKD